MSTLLPPPDEVVGVLLLNLGTPDGPDVPSVRRYLRQFLSDPRVLDIGAIPRRLLLHGIILRTRPAQSAHAYRKVWTSQGSPLLVHSLAFAQAVQRELGAPYVVELGMRYGSPSIAAAWQRLKDRGASRLVVMPLYPHPTSSSTGSSLEETFRVLSREWDVPPVAVVPGFHAEPSFLEAWQQVLRPEMERSGADHVLFSFHGLPERHVRKSDRSAACRFDDGCCALLSAANRNCYRAQCFDTARRLAQGLALAPDRWSVSFQSRLGRTPWIRPYTDLVVREMPGRGVRRLLVACTGFVADCLETLEEIGLRARADFIAHGGQELTLAPCLNAHPAWARSAADLVRRTAGPAAPSASPGPSPASP